jgi:peptide/nickel transport system substrate-binding protein
MNQEYRKEAHGMKKIMVLLMAAILVIGVFAQGPSLKKRDPDTLVVVLTGPCQPLDPNLYTTLNEAQVMHEINETLIGMRTDDTFYPLLAESIPTVENGLISKDYSVYTIKLRKNVKFHNGNPLTADDVVFSFNRILHHPKSSAKSMFSAIMLVEKVDDYTVRIHWGRLKNPEYATVAMNSWADRAKYMTASPYGPALNILSHYCSGIEDAETVEAAGADYGTKVVVGTGPFKLDTWPNPTEVNLTRNEAWWGGASTVAFKNIKYRTITESSQVNNVLLTGEVDVAYNMSLLDLNSLEKAGIKISSQSGVTIHYGYFNMNSVLVGQMRNGKMDLSGKYDTLDSTHLRKAMFYSLNPAPFIRQVDLFNGQALLANQMMQPGFIGYVEGAPAGTPFVEFNEKTWYQDRAKAKAEFAALSPEFRAKLVPECLTLAVPNTSTSVKLANNVKDQVKTGLGIDLIKVIPMVNSQIVQMRKTGEGYDMIIGSWFTPTADSDYTCLTFNGESIGTGMNGSLYNSDIVNASIQKARYSLDPKVRKEAYTTAQVQLMSDKALFPMVFENTVFSTHPRVGNLDSSGFKSKLIDLYRLTKLF